MNYRELLDGWFDRDGDKFVKLITKDRLDWEGKADLADGLSTYVHGKIKQEDLLRIAYKAARSTISSMALPNKVTLKLHPTMSATDHDRLFVATECFDASGLTPNQKLDVFLGLTIHECCHVLFTDNAYMKTQPLAHQKIIHHLWNIIEDEMIETRLADHSPGYMGYIVAAKDYHFDYKYQQEIKKKALLKKIEDEEEETSKEDNTLDRLMDILFKIVRYPKHLNDDDFLFYGKYIIDIKDILCPFPLNTKDCFEAAVKIWDLFKQFYKEPPKSVSEDKPLTIAILTDGMEESDAPDEGDGETPDIIIDMRTKAMDETEIEEETGDSLDKDILKDLINGGILQAISEAIEHGAELGDDAGDQLKMALTLRQDETFGPLLDGGLEQGTAANTFFEKKGPNQHRYLDAKKEVNQYIAPVRRALQNHGRDIKIVHKGMRSGYLDTNKLAEAVQGVNTVYERHGTVKSDKIGVVLVVDESGSMHGTKIASARKSAVLLDEALRSIPYIDLFVYGHTADQKKNNSTDIHIYKEPGWDKKFALGSVEDHANNRDGVALTEIAARVRKYTDRPVLMFVLADGQPNARNYTDNYAISHTRDAVKQIERKGFQVIQVCIENGYDPKKMFTHFIKLKDLNRLAKDLTLVVRKAAEKLSKIHVS